MDERVLLAEQEVLGGALQRLGSRLYERNQVDPVATTETVLRVLTSIRTWMEAGTVLSAMEEVSLPTLEAWQEELGKAAVHLQALEEIIDIERHRSLRDRNPPRRMRGVTGREAS